MILSGKHRKCSTKEAALWKETNFTNMLATILLAKILVPVLCTVWHACFWHGHHVGKLENILIKNTTQHRHVVSVWLPCQYFIQIFFRVYGACSVNYFLTNILTHTKLHQHVWLTLINSLANMLAQFIPVYKFMNTRFYHWFLVR